jgi:RNA polymerase sigma-70 factor (ECF subfamily)
MAVMRALLALALKEGAQAWPGVEVSSDRLSTYLDQRFPEVSSTPPPRAADLFLACACLCGDAVALQHLDLMCRDELRFALRRLRTTADEKEVLAAVMAKLLVAASGEEPKLAQYNGQSELHSWIQVVVARHIIYEKRLARPTEAVTEALLEELVEAGGSQWRAMDSVTRQVFKESLAKALASLSPRDRNLLRYRLDGLSYAAIADLHQVRSSTVSRWLGRVNVTVKHVVLADLRRSLRLESSELDSLVRSVLGQMNSSIRLQISRAFQDESA